MTRRRAGLAILLLGLLVASGLRGPTGAAAGPPAATSGGAATATTAEPATVAPQRVTLRLGILPVTAFLGMYLARDRGWLEEEGINLDLVAMAGGAEIVPAMIGGSLDVGITNTFSHVLARNQQFDVRAIAAGGAEIRGEPTHALLVRADSPIQAARDLDGRTMATNTLNNIDHLMQQVWMQQNGVDPSRVRFQEIPFPQMAAALAQNRIDAIGPTEPFVTIAQRDGARILAYHYTDVNPSTLIAYYAATGDWLARNADTARRFARAVHRANEWLQANPDEKRPAAARFLNIPPEVAARINIEELQTRIDPAGIQWWIDAGRRFNLVTATLSPDEFLFETVR